jgi:hypothetical protein
MTTAFTAQIRTELTVMRDRDRRAGRITLELIGG